MGSFALVSNKSQTIMKVLFLVALAIAAVVAEPEAEAGAPNPYFGPPYEPNYYADPKAYNYGYYGYPHGYYGYPHHLLGKRSAGAQPEAEADPAVVYHGVTGVYGLGHYGHLGHLGHLGYAIAKPTMESAEAAEDATAKPTLVYPGVYGHGLYGHHLAAVPAVVTAENRVHGAFVPQKVVVPGTVGHPAYAGLLGGSLLGVTHHAVKREAEAEPEAEAAPEADAWYGHYYGHPYGGYYGYNGYNGYPYIYGGYYGYGHSYWG